LLSINERSESDKCVSRDFYQKLEVRAAIFDEAGLENLRLVEVPPPEAKEGEIIVRVMVAGVNPIDYFVVSGMRKASPIPHIPGVEFAGLVEDVGPGVEGIKVGDKVIIYPRVFDGSCDLCTRGLEMLCRNGGLIGVVSNGCFAEGVKVSSKNVFKVEGHVDWELAASIPVSALTPYHALKQAHLGVGDLVVVVGAAGNTGMFAVQFASMMGARVIAVSRKDWIKEFGAHHVVGLENAHEEVKKVSEGKMADVVIDSLGTNTFNKSLELVGLGGRLLTFGTLTGNEASVSIFSVYNRHISILGCTGGTRGEMAEIIDIRNKLKVKVWKKFKLNEVRSAIESIFSKDRDGRILLEINQP